MGLLLSRSDSHGENNSVQSAFYTNRNLNCQTVSVKRSLQTIVFTMRIRTWQQQSHCVLTLKTIVRSQSSVYILYSPIVRKRIPFCILSFPSPSPTPPPQRWLASKPSIFCWRPLKNELPRVWVLLALLKICPKGSVKRILKTPFQNAAILRGGSRCG